MKVVVATDGSDFSKDAVEEFCVLFSTKPEIEIKVVSVFEEDYALAAEPFAVSAELYREVSEAAERQAEHSATEAMDVIRDRFRSPDTLVTVEVVKGNAEQEIVEIARSWGADLIVVGSHGRGFWGRMLGSVSDAVIHHAPCSVLVVRHSTS
jgi:nucleotide-binding universal stress UspA family protein